MPIKVAKGKTIPAIVYDHIHITAFNLTLDESNNPKYKVYIEFVFYAMVDGNKQFDHSSRQKIGLNDLMEKANELAAQGNTKLLEAVADFQSAAAKYVEATMPELGAATIEP